ncbi:hypothetical protein DL764_002852 [Monosporascus ibericus]|uniref:Uncharacterized protein n=1 Tax=Monosporascus ibericus TaxID=155417 RepID=A0A4Q4TL95_9PEZI|nr:hypothetical protein DL764_002852 [Monosporascus ibericus]
MQRELFKDERPEKLVDYLAMAVKIDDQQNTWTPVPQGPPRNNQGNDNRSISMIRIRDEHNPPKEVQQGLQEPKELSQAIIQK